MFYETLTFHKIYTVYAFKHSHVKMDILLFCMLFDLIIFSFVGITFHTKSSKYDAPFSELLTFAFYVLKCRRFSWLSFSLLSAEVNLRGRNRVSRNRDTWRDSLTGAELQLKHIMDIWNSPTICELMCWNYDSIPSSKSPLTYPNFVRSLSNHCKCMQLKEKWAKKRT